MVVLGTRIRKLFWNCTKSQTFSNSCAQNHHDLLAKIVGVVNGTKCGQLCCYKHWALVSAPSHSPTLKKMVNNLFEIYENKVEQQT